MAYTMNDYRRFLNERDSHDIGTPGWNLGQQNVENIVEKMMKSGSEEMAHELVDEIYSLLDCGFDLDSEEIKKDMALLEENGFEELAEEIREEM